MVVAEEEMKLANAEEAELSRTAGRVCDDGIPSIDVVVDGAWCKRSYGNNYNSLGGVVSTIIQFMHCNINLFSLNLKFLYFPYF